MAAESDPHMRFTPEAFEVFGRVMTVLLGPGALGGSTAHGVNTWVCLNGGFAVGWTGGPHPTEVADDLIALAQDNNTTPVLTPGDVVPGDVVPGDVVPGDVVPGDVVPGDVVPGDVVPGDVVPVDTSDPSRVRLLVRNIPVELEGTHTTGMEAESALIASC